jgi:hypothetical protein
MLLGEMITTASCVAARMIVEFNVITLRLTLFYEAQLRTYGEKSIPRQFRYQSRAAKYAML